MAPGTGIKAPVPRTRTGCLTCRKRKVKCDETKPICGRCERLQRECVWSEDLQVISQGRPPVFSSATIITTRSDVPALQLSRPSGQNFVLELPTVDRAMIPYVHHFVSFCCRFMAYSNDNEGNPFQEALAPLAMSSPALIHSISALAASHLARNQPSHEITAANHYSIALRELQASLSDAKIAQSDATLGACLLLCVYEISHSDRSSYSSSWLEHLQGARDLILFRGGPRTSDYLTRFFSLLDVSGALFSGKGTLLQGNYWIDDGTDDEGSKALNWPYYDGSGVMTDHFHQLMTHMAKLSQLSSEALGEIGQENPDMIAKKGTEIYEAMLHWWSQCPPELRDQNKNWRRLPREKKLTVSETLEEEAFSSTKACLLGCVIYLHHILDPVGREPQKNEVTEAIIEILEIAEETPQGYGLEMGLYWALFMAGVAVFNDVVAEDLIRKKLRSDMTVSLYHADRALDLLEVLWKRQHQYGTKYDWRLVQSQMGIQVFILA